MVLTQKYRSNIYTKLVPVLGEQEAEALLAELPANELDSPASKDFIRAEVSDLRAEVRIEIGRVDKNVSDLRTEMSAEIGRVDKNVSDLRTEMSAEIGRVDKTVSDLRAEMMNRFRSQTIWLSGVILAVAGIVRFG